MNEKLIDIFERFSAREDNAIWDLTLTPDGDNIHILMETNEAYTLNREDIMNIKLEKTIRIDEEDFIRKPFNRNHFSRK